jgi:hypothetical protein
MNLRQSTYVVLACGLLSVAAIAGIGSKAKKTNVHGVGWYASFSDALAESKRTGKPILFLSMFGKLDEEMPCANARTLRATLFKDPEFKKLISDDVIPAWEMVRAVPKIEIDLGDGKKIKRTVRGNAVMYLCNSDGQVVDAYPGVYASEHFLPAVRESILMSKKSTAEILAWHESNGKVPRERGFTLGKMAVESPTLSLIGARPIEGSKTDPRSQDPKRARFLTAALRIQDLSLTPLPSDDIAFVLTGKGLTERTPEQVGMDILNRDSVRNITQMRGLIHLWLASEPGLPNPASARDTVLETILKIPYKDPYFGLKDIVIPGTPN